MYLLYVDESGSHGPQHNRAYVLAGLAVHAADAWDLQMHLQRALADALPEGFDPDDFELHAAEIRRPSRARSSAWQRVEDGQVRRDVLLRVFDALHDFVPRDQECPVRLFAAVAEPDDPAREERAYEALLNCFDDTLREGRAGGIVISDVIDHELHLQHLAEEWRRKIGRLGQLDHLCEVPLFADSRSTRLLQAADVSAWALWRYFGSETADATWLRRMAPRIAAPGIVSVARDGSTRQVELPATLTR
jgi:hypothetical protein